MDTYKKNIKEIYNFIDTTRHIKRFNNISYIDGYDDSVLDHSARVAFLSVELAEHLKKEFSLDINLFLVVKIAMFHDLAEIKTGDLSGPVKDEVPEIRRLLELVEQEYLKKIFYKDFIDLIYNSLSLEKQIVHLADKLDVLLQMRILQNKYPKRTNQYKNIKNVEKTTLDRVKRIDVYNIYFKDFLNLEEVDENKNT